ncbi:hypothetical protein [Mesorhizobium sp. ANAO-SY3R2]|uniref:hypothetical protein n=1 Tax=Mesorhizobium sp. ANAO-SY3R2 TaxID=3166644 RepID=UPI00366CD6F2
MSIKLTLNMRVADPAPGSARPKGTKLSHAGVRLTHLRTAIARGFIHGDSLDDIVDIAAVCFRHEKAGFDDLVGWVSISGLPFSDSELEDVWSDAEGRPLHSLDEIGRMLSVTPAQRERCRLWTLGARGEGLSERLAAIERRAKERRDRDRIRKMIQRRNAGCVPRARQMENVIQALATKFCKTKRTIYRWIADGTIDIRVSRMSEGNKDYLYISPETQLTKSVACVARAIGRSRSTVHRWLKDGWTLADIAAADGQRPAGPLALALTPAPADHPASETDGLRSAAPKRKRRPSRERAASEVRKIIASPVNVAGPKTNPEKGRNMSALEDERERIRAITGTDVAKRLPALANTLAVETNFSAEQALAILAVASDEIDARGENPGRRAGANAQACQTWCWSRHTGNA